MLNTNAYVTYTPEGKILLPNIKKMFLPDVGKEIADIDLSGADIQVVACDSECKWLLDFFASKQDKKVYAYIASEYFQRDISDKSDEYKTYKGVFHGCLTGEHEVLTYKGWVRLDQYNENLPLMVWESKTRETFFEIPKGFNRDYVDASEPLVHIKGTSFEQIVTQDHKFLRVSNAKDFITEAKDLPKASRLPYTGNYRGGITSLDNNLVKLIVAFQADGTIAHTSNAGVVTYSFRFAKARKVARLKTILHALGVNYVEGNTDFTSKGNPVTSIRFKGTLKPEWKYLDWSILDWSRENLEIFVNELQYWDGSTRTSNGIRTSITTTNRQAMEVLQTVIQLTGKGSKVIHKVRDTTRKDIYEVSINNSSYFNLTCGTKSFIEHKGTNVYCPQTSTGFFMVRYKGHVMVTGNTNYLLGIAKLAKMAGISEELAKGLQDFYFKLNPEVREWHKRLENDIKNKGYVQNKFGRRMQFNYATRRFNPNLMNEVAAAIPQSTIADLINRIWVAIARELPQVDILMQVHDSLVLQYDLELAIETRSSILEVAKIPVPYNPPLYIGSDIKVSSSSYGETKKPILA